MWSWGTVCGAPTIVGIWCCKQLFVYASHQTRLDTRSDYIWCCKQINKMTNLDNERTPLSFLKQSKGITRSNGFTRQDRWEDEDGDDI